MLIYLLMMFRYVMVYFDDYGYYSLSYGVGSSISGTDFSIRELIDFLKKHYLLCNGRILSFFIWLFFFWLGDLVLVQIVAAVITTGLLCIMWKFISPAPKYSLFTALFICALYGLFPIALQQHGTYWMAAFFCYIAPVLSLMAFIMLYTQNRERGFTGGQMVLLFVLAFLSAFSQEQISVSVLFLMLLLLIWDITEKRKSTFTYVLIIAALFCMAVLMISPGLQNRASAHDNPIFERILYNTENTIRMFFSNTLKAFVILLFGALISVSISLFSTEKGILRIIDALAVGCGCFSILVYCHAEIQSFLSSFLDTGIKVILAGVFSAGIIFVQVFRYYLVKKEIARLLVFCTAVASVGCLCFVSEHPWRLLLPSWILMFPLLADGIIVFSEKLTLPMGKCLCLTCVLAISVFSIDNQLEIFTGYYNNAGVHQYNDAVLRDAAEREKNGDPITKIFLKEIPEPMYGCVMVYEDGLQYMKYWMMNYYGFTSNPKLYFSMDGKETTTPDEFYVEKELGIFVKRQQVTIETVYATRSEAGVLTVTVECNPIYKGSRIEVNGMEFPTTVGDTSISAVIGDAEEPLSVAVVVPDVNLRSQAVVVEAVE